MTQYEKQLKKELQSYGHNFLFDTVGKNVREVTQNVSKRYGYLQNELVVVQGECIDGGIGCSKWLVFKKGEDFNAEKSM